MSVSPVPRSVEASLEAHRRADRGAVRVERRRIRRYLRRREPLMRVWLLALPRGERRHAQAIVAYLFELDDLADAGTADPSTRRVSLVQERTRLRAAIARDHPHEASLGVVVEALRALDVPEDTIGRHFDALLTELEQPSFETFADWHSVMEPFAALLAFVASSHVVVGRAEVWSRLRELIIGLAAIDVLVDIATDLDGGRVLLPREDLRRFGANPSLRQVTPAWRDLMRFEIARARALTNAGAEGFALLPARSRYIFRVALASSAERLAVIERNGYDVFSQPVRVPRRRQLAVAVRGVLFG